MISVGTDGCTTGVTHGYLAGVARIAAQDEVRRVYLAREIQRYRARRRTGRKVTGLTPSERARQQERARADWRVARILGPIPVPAWMIAWRTDLSMQATCAALWRLRQRGECVVTRGPIVSGGKEQRTLYAAKVEVVTT